MAHTPESYIYLPSLDPPYPFLNIVPFFDHLIPPNSMQHMLRQWRCILWHAYCDIVRVRIRLWVLVRVLTIIVLVLFSQSADMFTEYKTHPGSAYLLLGQLKHPFQGAFWKRAFTSFHLPPLCHLLPHPGLEKEGGRAKVRWRGEWCQHVTR